ncbi:FtsX-like permease family protein [Chitinophaga polysaccharea]|uniref:ABC transporter permease n=1 Tax=Chitinophaga polysaccharea TaxID=1293035 RepID=UPI0014559A1A|nr:FtsX-like permease family protein [Chitinophaga polysaccharea]NLR57701.1 FtsX-like permease family protein [Chitinophaga polysaccharea]
MLKNYLKVARRNLLKNKAYSIINIAGLAAGMTIVVLIGLWEWDELTFDHYHKNHADLAQIMDTQTFNGETNTGTAVALPLKKELQSVYGGYFKALSLASWNNAHILTVGNKKISQSGMWVEPDFPLMLSVKMVSGSSDALKDPSSMLIASSVAKSLFGEQDPINQLVRLDNQTDMKIAGVYEDLPYNTSFYNTKFLLPWSKYLTVAFWLKDLESRWDTHCAQLFVQLNSHTSPAKVTATVKNVMVAHLDATAGSKEEILLHPMDRWHLYSEFKNGSSNGGRIQFVWLFGIIGGFVLLLACINFMNLSTARSEKRAREVGVRKANGSTSQQLISQFLTESLFVAFIAFLLSVLLVQLLIPVFNNLADKQIRTPLQNPLYWLIMLVFTVFTGLLAGSYPAFYLSGFQPVKVLKGTFKPGRQASVPRKVLVVLQFTVSVALIIGTLIVYKQIKFTQSRPVGYTREGLIMSAIGIPEFYRHYDAIRNDLLQSGVVDNAAASNSPATEVQDSQMGFEWKDKDPESKPLFGIVNITHDYGKTIKWEIKEGRDFSRSFPSDTGTFILNEAAVKLTGLKHPVGEIIRWKGKEHVITGVVKDMVTGSPYKAIQPTIFMLDYGWLNVITTHIKPNIPVREALARIGPVFNKYSPDSPFEYKFVDEEYAKKFSDEERIGKMATFFTVLAIFISCLGLFGLASFVAEQRKKEITVRKVLGASVFSLWEMLSREFVILVLTSCFIAIPASWYFLDHWLQKYEYRTQISWWIFVVAVLASLIITLLTVSFQAIKAALKDPAKSLRSE